MNIIILAAVAANGTIGHAGKIPWHISDDLKRFKRLTLGHPVIMGRRTFESLGQPLPGRRNIILTRGPAIPGVECFSNLQDAIAACGKIIKSHQCCHPERSEGSQSLHPLSTPEEILRSAQNDKPQGEDARTSSEVFIIGGAEVYRAALPVADTLLLTEVHQEVAGDTRFPDYDRSAWQEVSREEHPGYAFVEYRRR